MDRMPIIDMAATGRNIARLRVDAGLTVRELQAVFGFRTPQAIYKWQHGAALPTLDNLAVLAALFGVRMDDILIFRRDGQDPFKTELSGSNSAGSARNKFEKERLP